MTVGDPWTAKQHHWKSETKEDHQLSKNKKYIKKFHLKMNLFTAVKYCCILHGRVCVMLSHVQDACIYRGHFPTQVPLRGLSVLKIFLVHLTSSRAENYNASLKLSRP